MNLVNQPVALLSLAPRRVIEVIDHTFRIYRDNFIAFFGLVAVFTVPINLIQFSLSQSVQQNPLFTTDEFGMTQINPDATPVVIVYLIGVFLNLVVVNSLITYVASENYLGKNVTIQSAVAGVAGRFLTLIGAILLMFILLIVAGVIMGILGIVGNEIGSAITCIALLCMLPVGLLMIYFFLATAFCGVPVIMLEKVGVLLGIRRAFYLGKVRFWRVFGFFIGVTFIVRLIQLTLGVIAVLIVGTSFSPSSMFFPTSPEATALGTALSTIISILTAPILPIGFTLMYYDTRIRVEGLDIILQAVDSPEPHPREVASPVPPSLFNRQDALNIVLLVVGSFAICCGCYALLLGLALAATSTL